jgi:hypothetical protein
MIRSGDAHLDRSGRTLALVRPAAWEGAVKSLTLLYCLRGGAAASVRTAATGPPVVARGKSGSIHRRATRCGHLRPLTRAFTRTFKLQLRTRQRPFARHSRRRAMATLNVQSRWGETGATGAVSVCPGERCVLTGQNLINILRLAFSPPHARAASVV